MCLCKIHLSLISKIYLNGLLRIFIVFSDHLNFVWYLKFESKNRLKESNILDKW